MYAFLLIPAGMFTGIHLLLPGLVTLAFSITGVWLALRRFDAFARAVTITWGFAVVASVLAPMLLIGLPADAADLLYFGLVLTIAVWISGLAMVTQPKQDRSDSSSDR